jgi:hypothetical protein
MADAPGHRFVNVSGDGILFGGRIELAPLDPLLLGFPEAGEIARERVRQIGHDAFQRQNDGRRDLSKAVTLLIDAHESPVRDAWLAFGRATMSGGDLDQALRVAVDTLSTPLDLGHDMPHAPSGLLPAADRAFLLRHALIASDEDVVAVPPTDASTVALHSAVQRLTRLATPDDRCEKPQPTMAVLRTEAGRVPVSLLFNWPRDVRHEIARLEDDLARAIEPALRGVALGPAEYTTAQALGTRDPFTLLAHSWLSAARYSSDHRLLDSPATVRWILEALLVEPRDAERAEEPSLEIRLDARTALPLIVPAQRPATALTGLLCVADATGREWRPQVTVRRSGGAEGTGASWLRLFEGPALRCAMTAPPQWALEQCPSWTAVAHADGWSAEAFPDANVVRITSPDTRVAWLGVVAAESVAWAGESLLVTSMGPELRSFENVRRRIEGAGG